MGNILGYPTIMSEKNETNGGSTKNKKEKAPKLFSVLDYEAMTAILQKESEKRQDGGNEVQKSIDYARAISMVAKARTLVGQIITQKNGKISAEQRYAHIAMAIAHSHAVLLKKKIVVEDVKRPKEIDYGPLIDNIAKDSQTIKEMLKTANGERCERIQNEVSQQIEFFQKEVSVTLSPVEREWHEMVLRADLTSTLLDECKRMGQDCMEKHRNPERKQKNHFHSLSQSYGVLQECYDAFKINGLLPVLESGEGALIGDILQKKKRKTGKDIYFTDFE